MKKRCVHCLLPETFPGIEFDSHGVCSLCLNSSNQADMVKSRRQLKNKMDELIRSSKDQGGQYDAVVAYSGGKDSSFLLHYLQKEYDLKILAVTFDNGFLPEAVFENMRRVIGSLDIDHLILKPRPKILKRIFLISALEDIYPMSLLQGGSSVCVSCIRMVAKYVLQCALEKNIPLIMIGNSPGQLLRSEKEIIYKDNLFPYEMRRKLFESLAEKLSEQIYPLFILEKQAYATQAFPYTVNPLPLIGYDEDTIYKTIAELGWKRPEALDACSSNCQLNAFGIVKHLQRHGFHPYDFEMSLLVRQGIISREEGLRRVREPEGKTVQLASRIEKLLFSSTQEKA